MKLVKRNYKTQIKTKVWCIETNGKRVIKRKLFTCYDTTLKEVENMLTKKLVEK